MIGRRAIGVKDGCASVMMTSQREKENLTAAGLLNGKNTLRRVLIHYTCTCS